MKSISDKAEISVDFPDKTYIGAFGRESSFEVKVEPEEVLLRIIRPGEQRRQFAIHLHYHLLADILAAMAEGLAEHSDLNQTNLAVLREASDNLARALKGSGRKKRGAVH